ncbi:MAG TPA: acetamidase/formamidase family protein [Spirochaetia bacterium]|nr:acetamidase/formamidase family protein [Spirochaetia bacterium]
MTEHRLEPKIYYYTYGPHEPALRIHSGDTVVAETRDSMGADARGNLLPEEMKQKVPGTSLKESNPASGPIYVEEAEQGDLLAVHIEGIRLTRDYAVSKQTEHFGSLTGEWEGHHLLYNAPFESIMYRWKLDLERNTGTLELPQSRVKGVEVPLDPFIGSIGVAPRFGRVETTLTPGEFGGNMDCVETRAGTTLYLPVWVRGGYLSFGDIHAVQGDGEVCGTATEVTAEVTLGLEVVKGRSSDWPRLENDSHIMVIGSTRPLMDCVRLAQIGLLNWLVDDYGFHREEAWQLMAQVGKMRIGNIVDPCYTVVAKFPKRYLP